MEGVSNPMSDVQVTANVTLVPAGSAFTSTRLAPTPPSEEESQRGKVLPTLTGSLASGNAISLR